MVDSYEKVVEVDDLYDRIAEFTSLNNGTGVQSSRKKAVELAK